MKKTEITETLQITPLGRKYKTTLTEKYKNRKIWKKPDPQEIYSIIPCTVSAIYVSENSGISKGEKILEFEAMKMKNILTSPFEGTVKKICVNEGDKIAKGVLMLIIENGEKEEESTISTSPDPVG